MKRSAESRGMESQLPYNPYAPPKVLEENRQPDWHDGYVWRSGSQMIIKSGAALPGRCFITGDVTQISVNVSQLLRPLWLYLLILPGIIPFLVLAPFFGKSIQLKVPISRAILDQHIRYVNVGFVLLVIGTLLAIGGGLAFNLSDVLAIGLPLGILCAYTGFLLSSRPPITLHVVRLSGECLVLSNVHEDVLSELPEADEELLSQVGLSATV